MGKKIRVVKSDGHSVPFNFNKVRSTCIRAGVGNSLATSVAKRISEKIYPDITQGACISHEINLVATKAGSKYMIECKFHNSSGIYAGVKE